MAIDLETLTLGEVAKVEEFSGLSFAQVAETTAPKGKLMAALVWVAKRREQLAEGAKPSFTWNEALAVPFADANAIIGITADDDDAPALGDEDDDPKAE